MKTFRSILCPIDFSPFSEVALRYASAFAVQYDAGLVVVHSIPDYPRGFGFPDILIPTGVPQNLKSAVSGGLDELAAKFVPQNVALRRIVNVGNPADVITEVASSEDVDLIVMGTHGKTGMERFLLGSVTNKVLHKSQAPVLVVGKTTRHFIQADPEHPMKIDRILCPIDMDSGTEEITTLALNLARSFQSEVYVLHVLAKHESTPRTLAMQKLQTFVDAGKEDWCTIQHLVNIGHPAEEILIAVEKNSINLIVMGHRARGPIADAMIGSNTIKVLTQSECPVFVQRI